MSVLPSERTPTPNDSGMHTETISSADADAKRSELRVPRVVITEQELLLGTVAAVALPRSKMPWWTRLARGGTTAARSVATKRAPRPARRRYAPRSHSYFESALIDREMRPL
jgi:hypothetical protein